MSGVGARLAAFEGARRSERAYLEAQAAARAAGQIVPRGRAVLFSDQAQAFERIGLAWFFEVLRRWGMPHRPCRAFLACAKIMTVSPPRQARENSSKTDAGAIVAPVLRNARLQLMRTLAPRSARGRGAARGAEWHWPRSRIGRQEPAIAKYA